LTYNLASQAEEAASTRHMKELYNTLSMIPGKYKQRNTPIVDRIGSTPTTTEEQIKTHTGTH